MGKMNKDPKVVAAEWLEKQGFNEEGTTYCYVTPDSFARKDELKEAGFKYNPMLGWHRGSAEGYEENCIEMHTSICVEFTAWGEGIYYPDTKDKVAEKAKAILPESHSQFVGEIGGKFEALATLKEMRTINTRWGLNNVFTFEDKDENILVWFTTSDKFAAVAETGKTYFVKGGIKKHETYRGVDQTYLTRCTIKEV